MGVWDTSTPAGNEAKSLGDDRIRELKTAVEESLRGGAAEGTEAVFPGTSPSTAPVFRYRGLRGTEASRPTAGQYGFFFNTTKSELQRDNGTSWEGVGTHIPSGTKMVFYQSTAPTGWTAVAVNDMFLRVVTAGGTGGTTGGTVAASTSLAHTHGLSNHFHNVPLAMPTSTGSILPNLDAPAFIPGASANDWFYGQDSVSLSSVYRTSSKTGSPDEYVIMDDVNPGSVGVARTSTSGGSTDSTFAGAFQRADVIIATKD